MSEHLTIEEWLLSEEAERLREESYLSGQEVGRIVGWLDGQCAMRERASDLVRAIRNECTLADYHYRNGWLDSATYAEMRIRALEGGGELSEEAYSLLNWARKAKVYMGHDEDCSRLGARLEDGSRPECDCGLWDLLDQVGLLNRTDPNPTDQEVTP